MKGHSPRPPHAPARVSRSQDRSLVGRPVSDLLPGSGSRGRCRRVWIASHRRREGRGTFCDRLADHLGPGRERPGRRACLLGRQGREFRGFCRDLARHGRRHHLVDEVLELREEPGRSRRRRRLTAHARNIGRPRHRANLGRPCRGRNSVHFSVSALGRQLIHQMTPSVVSSPPFLDLMMAMEGSDREGVRAQSLAVTFDPGSRISPAPAR